MRRISGAVQAAVAAALAQGTVSFAGTPRRASGFEHRKVIERPTSMRKHLRGHYSRYTHVLSPIVADKNLARLANRRKAK